jgi:hypothetical protein
MAMKLNEAAYKHAVAIIQNGLEVEHDSKNWDDVKATSDEEVRFLNSHNMEEYGSWFLGIDTDADPKNRNKYRYPFGDFSVLHRSALIAAEKEAGKHHHHDIKMAVQKLLAMIDGKKHAKH